MYNLGSAQVDSGQGSAAVPLLQEVVKIYNHPTGADYYLGRALAAEGKDDQAVQAFVRATQLQGRCSAKPGMRFLKPTAAWETPRRRGRQC